MALTLKELLDEERFGLRLVTAAPAGQQVRGVSVIEWPEPAEWTAPGYLVVTNGLALRRNTQKQRRFVEELHRAGAAAMGVWTPATSSSIPPTMVATAEEVGLPVLEIPTKLPSWELSQYVMRAALSIEDGNLSRALVAQDYLLGSLDQPDPLETLANRVHSLLHTPVVIFSPVGRVLSRSGHAPVAPMWAAVCSDRDLVEFEHRWLFAMTAAIDSQPYAHLVVRLQHRPRPAAYTGAVVLFAGRVLQMIALARHAAIEQERAARCAALRELLNGAPPSDAMLERLEVFGFGAHSGVRVLVADVSGVDLEAAVSTIAATCADRHIPCLVSTVGGEMIAVLDSNATRDLVDELTAATEARIASIGVGLPVDLIEGVRQSLREAEIARLRARSDRSESMWFEDISLPDLLLSYLPLERLNSARNILQPLRSDRPDLFETLKVYLENDCNVLRAAKTLHLHANSLRYRLSVIEKILGRSLSSIETLLELTLALRIDAVASSEAWLALAAGLGARSVRCAP